MNPKLQRYMATKARTDVIIVRVFNIGACKIPNTDFSLIKNSLLLTLSNDVIMILLIITNIILLPI